MKNIITALVLSVVSSFVIHINVMAEEAQDYKSEIISYLIPDFENAEGNVSRGEFLEKAVELCYGEQGYAATGFEDVTEYDSISGAIAYAENIGLIAKSDKFYPDIPITREQAVKILVNALGYGEYAKLAGGYPTGYMILGEKLEIFKNIKVGEYISGKDFETVLFNMLTAPFCRLEIQGTNISLVHNEDATMLSDIYDIYEFEGVVKANELTGLNSVDDKMYDGIIKIDNTEYYSEKEDYLGYNVKGYYKEEDGERTVITIYPYRNSEITIDAGDIENVENGVLEYLDGKTLKKIKVHKGFSFIYNRKAYEKSDAVVKMTGNEGEITLIDSDRDNVYETVKMVKKDYMPVSVVNTFDSILLSEKESLGLIDLSKDEIVYSISKNGEVCTIYDILSGDLISYIVSDDMLYYEINILSGETIEGKVTSISRADKTITLGDSEYNYNGYFETHCLAKSQIGSEYVFILDEEGKICYTNDNTNSFVYGWLAGVFLNEENEKLVLKIFTEKGSMEKIDVDLPVYVDGEAVRNINAAQNILSVSQDENRFIKYYPNKSGNIKKVDFPADATGQNPFDVIKNEEDSLTRYYSNETMQYQTSGKLFISKFKVSDNTKIFIIPETAEKRSDNENYKTVTASYFKNASSYAVTAYDIDSDFNAGAVVIFTDGNTLPTEASSAVVENVEQILNEDDEIVYSISILENGNFKTLIAKEELFDKVKTINSGDIIKYESMDNRLMAISCEYNCRKNLVTAENIQQVKYTNGYVYSYNAGYVSILKKNSLTDGYTYKDLSMQYTGNTKISHIYLTLDRDGNVKNVNLRQQPVSVIKGVRQAGDRADRIVIRSRFETLNSVWIYHIEE